MLAAISAEASTLACIIMQAQMRPIITITLPHMRRICTITTCTLANIISITHQHFLIQTWRPL
jgi:hypothetical protein